MIIRYARSGGHPPPPDREILTIDGDGSYTMWRSIGSAVHPPSPVGRFTGKLDAQTLESLKTAIEAVSLEGDLVIKLKPGSAVVNIDTGQVKARMGIHDEPDNAWSQLAELLRGLLRQLTNSPEAAIILIVSDDGRRARLEHMGQQSLQLDLSRLTVQAVLWKGYTVVDEWLLSESSSDENDPISADINWQMDLPFDHHFEPGDDQNVVAYVTFSIFHEGRFIPVKLTSS
jgi:hypothetical protein